MNSFGKSLGISLFGESHGPAVGALVTGLAPGIPVNMQHIQAAVDRRSAGANPGISTPRREPDRVEILSGVYGEGEKGLYTTGTPLCLVVRNQNARSKDYAKTAMLARPGHADYTGFEKYLGYADPRGGGHFSGRLTAPLVAAGAIATGILAKYNIIIGSHIAKISNIRDEELPTDPEELTPWLKELAQSGFPVLSEVAGEGMRAAIRQARDEKDSLGGVVETAVTGLEAGVGEPFFHSVESELSSLLFSIPGAKGVEFGAGFAFSNMRGSEANDPFYSNSGSICTRTNHNGGINGGITNGMPLVFRTVFKPTPSIGKLQETVELHTGEGRTLALAGRHDPCIVHRALFVVNAVAALALADLYSQRYGTLWQRGGQAPVANEMQREEGGEE